MRGLDTDILLRVLMNDEPVQSRRVMQEGNAFIPVSVRAALGVHRDGLAFADALHLDLCGRCDEFLTFDDKRFVQRAQLQNLMPVCVVPQ